MKGVHFLRPQYFIWLIVPIAIWVVYTNYGVPHMLWSYSWRDEGQGYDPHAQRWYTRCTFVGSYGEFTILPMDGHCPLLQFRKNVAGS